MKNDGRNLADIGLDSPARTPRKYSSELFNVVRIKCFVEIDLALNFTLVKLTPHAVSQEPKGNRTKGDMRRGEDRGIYIATTNPSEESQIQDGLCVPVPTKQNTK